MVQQLIDENIISSSAYKIKHIRRISGILGVSLTH
ncbi:MAG: hypothetical protein K0R52_923 [Alphaproteobacteria bacterium]|nr:hypothetical protein [Alphaproteobacteria bacterium]